MRRVINGVFGNGRSAENRARPQQRPGDGSYERDLGDAFLHVFVERGEKIERRHKDRKEPAAGIDLAGDETDRRIRDEGVVKLRRLEGVEIWRSSHWQLPPS